ncbi:hypothetical protein AMTRI_Chr05g58380 [Amborella trichopoda]
MVFRPFFFQGMRLESEPLKNSPRAPLPSGCVQNPLKPHQKLELENEREKEGEEKDSIQEDPLRERNEHLVTENPSSINMSSGSPGHKIVVGYALTSKKIKSFLQPHFEGIARKKGILFVAIDRNRSLEEQGPFDVVLHKLSGKDWRQILEDYWQMHPEVTILDPPHAIQHLYNRQSMLQYVADLNMSDAEGKIGVPKQLVVTKDPSSIPAAVTGTGLNLPLVVKPLVVDGTAKSHELSLAYDELSLSQLEPPLVLQEFVNHGGVLFKVYIVGPTVTVVRRFSLPDVDKRNCKGHGVIPFPRVSSAAASADNADLDPCVAELPPQPLLERLAKELQHRLGLRLFNIDIIRQQGIRDRYYVIDINYFPGYGKMPGYEQVFTDFLLSLRRTTTKDHTRSKHSRDSGIQDKAYQISS